MRSWVVLSHFRLTSSQGNLCSLGLCCQLFSKVQKCCSAVLGSRILVLLQCDGCSSNFFSPHLELFPFCAEMQDICAQIQCCVCGGCLASSHLGVSGPHLPLPGKDHIGHHLLPAPNTREDLNKHIHPVVTPSYMVLTSHVGNAWD